MNVMSLLGEGLLISNDTKWERNRRLMSPAFHFDVLKPYVAIYNDVAELLLVSLQSYEIFLHELLYVFLITANWPKIVTLLLYSFVCITATF